MTPLKYSTGHLPLHFRILGALLILIGVWRLMLADWSGLIPIVAGAAILFLQSHLVFDLSQKKYRSQIELLGLHFGTWHPTQPFTGLTITTITQSQTMSVRAASRVETDTHHQLIANTANGNISLLDGDNPTIHAAAQHIAQALAIPITDLTSNNNI